MIEIEDGRNKGVTLTRDNFASTYRTEKLQYFLESSCSCLQLLFLAQPSQMTVSGPSGAFSGGQRNSYFVSLFYLPDPIF